MDYTILISFFWASTLLALSPGPDNIFVLMQSMVNGVRYGIATVFGLISGCLVHTTLVAFGVSTIIKQNPKLFFAIKLLGALYLLYLAYKVFKSSADVSLSDDNVEKKSYSQLYRQGFLMNVLNPKVSIFFLAFFPGFLFSKSLSNVTQFYILGLLFMLAGFVVFSTIAFLSGKISNALAKNKNAGVFLKWMQIIVFIGIAIFILFKE